MKGISARRIKVKLGEVWESPNLHILFTREDEVIVARCLDFTISSHGENEKEALESLGSALKEYILTAVDDKATNILYDPAQNKYWRMFNDLEARTNIDALVKSRHTGENRCPVFCNMLKFLDSGFHRNDDSWAFLTFDEFINIAAQ